MTVSMIDWRVIFMPSIYALFNGGMLSIFNPPWVLFPLIPFALLPTEINGIAVFIAALAAFVFIAYRLGAHRIGIVAFALSPLAFNALMWGNVEWLALLGLVADARIGIPLMLVKPQITIGAVVFIAAEMARRREWARLAQTGAVTLGLVALSFMLDTGWTARTLSYNGFVDSQMNLSLFPLSVPCGIALMVTALRTRQLGIALLASPLFFPVVTPQCWLVVFLGLAILTPAAIALSASLWLYILRVRFV